MGKGKHVPIRTCIFCGRKMAKYELLRLVLDDEKRPIWDRKKCLPGRGAYVCPRDECLRKLETQKGRRRLAKAFRGRLARENPELFKVLIEAAGGQDKYDQNQDL
ncbi:YlxR family protein [Thermosulfurimonas dismutans]|uniref:Putative nucleic-acid-binding protein implicated in transcription termination n=1 Tax=Thermosulfurimonas dismutans TaxID=999894 RepID=A0A179D347_9BACT|nr:YlxR family protein [Thermosulfurimonas dismutans]OAQ20487.1 putative nucleic-acid-binding protein implicated in transcription termination [Thermosulfurimonas dismutans]